MLKACGELYCRGEIIYTPMNWQSFKDSLAENPEAPLQFEYASEQYVSPAYHITEIKQAQITSVDCGGQINAWTEVVVQLWVPEGKAEEAPMSSGKALKIIDLVEKSLQFHPNAPVKIEYGDADFPTRQMLIEEIGTQNGEVQVSLVADKTQCKANERGGECGPKKTEKPKIVLQSLGSSLSVAEEGDACTPGSGCC